LIYVKDPEREPAVSCSSLSKERATTNTSQLNPRIDRLRIAMGWTFLYAGLSQITKPNFTVAAFPAGAKIFYDQRA
jgi:hypothetical protein